MCTGGRAGGPYLWQLWCTGPSIRQCGKLPPPSYLSTHLPPMLASLLESWHSCFPIMFASHTCLPCLPLSCHPSNRTQIRYLFPHISPPLASSSVLSVFLPTSSFPCTIAVISCLLPVH